MEYNELLEEAKRRYPIGTVFKVVHNPNDICEVKNHEPYPVHDEKFINFYIAKPIFGCIGASVYKDGKWAEIVSLGVVIPTDEDYKYLIKLFKKLKIK
jgi:hypothetical protein